MEQAGRHNFHFQNIEKSQDEILALFQVDPKLPWFQGHFPGEPVLPAVSIIEISLHLLKNIQPQVSHTQLELKRSKFTAVVSPGQSVHISIKRLLENQWEILWVDQEDQTKLAQIRMYIDPA